MRFTLKFGFAIAALLGVMYLFAFPTRTYLDQRSAIAAEEHTVSVLTAENGKLSAESKALRDNATIEMIAREEYGLVKPGQQAFMVLPPPVPAVVQVRRPSTHRPWYAPLEFWDRL